MEQIGVTVNNSLLEINGILTPLWMFDRWIEEPWFLRVELDPQGIGITGVLDPFNYPTIHGGGINFPSQAQLLNGLMV